MFSEYLEAHVRDTHKMYLLQILSQRCQIVTSLVEHMITIVNSIKNIPIRNIFPRTITRILYILITYIKLMISKPKILSKSLKWHKIKYLHTAIKSLNRKLINFMYYPNITIFFSCKKSEIDYSKLI